MIIKIKKSMIKKFYITDTDILKNVNYFAVHLEIYFFVLLNI